MKKAAKTVQDVVVIGGGVAAMQAALALAGLKHRVALLCANGRLGGHAAAMPELYGYLANSSQEAVEQLHATVSTLSRRIAASKSIKVCPESTLKSVQGEVGRFVIKAVSAGAGQTLVAGAIVLAPGTGSVPATDAFNGKFSGLLTDMQGVLALIREHKAPKRVAILVDLAAEQERTVSAQVFSAAELLAASGVNVKVLCHNARVAAAGLESLYRRVRHAGVTVVKTAAVKLRAGDGDGIVVEHEDPVAETGVAEEFDLVVVADVKPGRRDTVMRALIAGLRTGPDGTLQYDNVWLLTTLTNRPGVFVVGAARGNSELREAMTDGLAAAGRVHDLLTGGAVVARKDVASVDSETCVLCLTCMRICPHGAIHIDNEKKAAGVSPLSCQRCGICAAECPAVAIQLPGFTDDQVADKVGAKPRVTVFACENSALLASETAARKLPSGTTLVKVPCAGKVDPRSVLEALRRGAHKVLVMGCHPENCRYLSGASRASRRIDRLGTALEKAGFDRSRVQYVGLASVESARFVEYATAP